MKDVFVEAPFAQVEFATEMGELTIYQKNKIISNNMDLDIISIDTTRDVGQDDCPTFSIVLVFKEDWYEQIGANDFVQITLGRGKEKSKVMYGLVDNVYKTWSFIDLKPTRSITISGRGFNKAFLQFGIGAVQEVNFNFQAVGFYEGQDEGYSQTTPARLIKTVFEYYLEKGIDMTFANDKNLKDYINTIFQENPEEEVTLGNTMGYYNYQGGLWDYIKELRNAPFYEVFWEIIDNKLTFIVRPTPFNPENWRNLLMTQVDDRDVIDENLGRTDLETYTVYAVKGESIVSNLDNIFGLPIWYEPFYKKYGLRRLEVQSKYTRFEELPVSENMVFGEAQMGSGAGGDLAYPVDSKHKITSKFGWRSFDKAFHKGTDFGAPKGSPIYAAEAGKIKYIGFDQYRGHYVDIQHYNGLVTRYQHCVSRPPLPVGTEVKRGQVIAQVGSTGVSTGPHLHFEVHENNKPVDPEKYIHGGSGKSGAKGKGISHPKYDAPIRSIEWNINENKEHDDKLQEIKNYDEEYLNDAKDSLPSNPLVDAGLLEDPIMDSLRDTVGDMTKAKQEEANRFDTINVSDKTIDLFNWNIMNNMMENGTIKLKGRQYQVGTRLYIKETDMEYYIEKVSHSFIYNENWTTTIEVTRGFPLGKRFEKPWNEWEIITAEDLERVTGISQAFMNKSNGAGQNDLSFITGGAIAAVAGLRGKIKEKALAMEGMMYSQDSDKRMSDNYSDCSSLVYKAVMEALGKDWKGTWAPSTSRWGDKQWSELWYEIPLKDAQPWDIAWRPNHVAFVGDGDKSFGATVPGQGAGYSEKFPGRFTKAYRVKGL